jgi:hypothetical protein
MLQEVETQEIFKTLEKPSRFCPDDCEFNKHGEYDICVRFTDCWHHQDRELPPRDITLHLPHGRVNMVTIVGENEVFRPMWILSDGSLISKRNPWEAKGHE